MTFCFLYSSSKRMKSADMRQKNVVQSRNTDTN